MNADLMREIIRKNFNILSSDKDVFITLSCKRCLRIYVVTGGNRSHLKFMIEHVERHLEKEKRGKI